ncbi:hypothetical protein PpBr36_02143 [Pyricularia pennisetigena]|uniref:hypothetical protein n=1 Tax=Pyricularia pennisetigena TaxID=1578925 RepID=UPI0011523A2A|nr:hypothetical protein PpBr36_02143 [Pyricularia pennisetigena]TLS28315.1 hypothetical protein PpBr36_02143 [Pyricularia pennisetigena]
MTNRLAAGCLLTSTGTQSPQLSQLAHFDSYSLCLWYSPVAQTQARGDQRGQRDRVMRSPILHSQPLGCTR